MALCDACFSFLHEKFPDLQDNSLASIFEMSENFSIFLASSGSFIVKNDNIQYFFAVLVANFEFAGFAPKEKYTGWTVFMETVRTAKS